MKKGRRPPLLRPEELICGNRSVASGGWRSWLLPGRGKVAFKSALFQMLSDEKNGSSDRTMMHAQFPGGQTRGAVGCGEVLDDLLQARRKGGHGEVHVESEAAVHVARHVPVRSAGVLLVSELFAHRFRVGVPGRLLLVVKERAFYVGLPSFAGSCEVGDDVGDCGDYEAPIGSPFGADPSAADQEFERDLLLEVLKLLTLKRPLVYELVGRCRD